MRDPYSPRCYGAHPDADKQGRHTGRLCLHPLGRFPFAVRWTRRFLRRFEDAGSGAEDGKVFIAAGPCARCGLVSELEVVQPDVALALAVADAHAQNALQLAILDVLKDEPSGIDSRRLRDRIEPRPSQQRVLVELRAMTSRGEVQLRGRARAARWTLATNVNRRDSAQFRAIRRDSVETSVARGVAA